MNAGMELVRSYLRINGFLLLGEVPVVQRDADDRYRPLTDVDVIAVRFPWARLIVRDADSEGTLSATFDPALDLTKSGIEVIIGEVKEGRPQLNPGLRSKEVLEVALARIGICPENEISSVIEDLRATGEAKRVNACGPFRVRLMAFGNAEGRKLDGYTVVSMKDAAAHLRRAARDYHRVLQPVQIDDYFVGFLHLLNKLED